MSRLFGGKAGGADDHPAELPLLTELEPEIEAEAQRLDALPLPQLAAEILIKAFTTDSEPGSGMMEIGNVVDVFLPPHREFTGPVYKIPKPSDAHYRLIDVIREGVQVLEHGGLLMPQGHNTNGNWYVAGYVTTRLARAAMAEGSVERLLPAVAPYP